MSMLFLFALCRQVGNFGLIAGYIILLNFNLKKGLIIKLICGTMTLPSLIVLGLFDAAILVGFYLIIEGAALWKIVRNDDGSRIVSTPSQTVG